MRSVPYRSGQLDTWFPVREVQFRVTEPNLWEWSFSGGSTSQGVGIERFISLPPSFLCLLPVCGWDAVSWLPTPPAFCLAFIAAMDSSQNQRPWVAFAYGVYHSNMDVIPISILVSLAAGSRARHSRQQHVFKTNSLLFSQVSWWIIIPKLDKIQLVGKGMLGTRQVFHLKFQSKPKVEPPRKQVVFIMGKPTKWPR